LSAMSGCLSSLFYLILFHCRFVHVSHRCSLKLCFLSHSVPHSIVFVVYHSYCLFCSVSNCRCCHFFVVFTIFHRPSTTTSVIQHSKTRVQRLAGHLPASVKSRDPKTPLRSTGDNRSLIEESQSTLRAVESTKSQHAVINASTASAAPTPLASSASMGSGDFLANEKHTVEDPR